MIPLKSDVCFLQVSHFIHISEYLTMQVDVRARRERERTETERREGEKMRHRNRK